MAKTFNGPRFYSSTTGTGSTIAVGAAVVGYLTPAQAGVANNDVIVYGITDGANYECGTATYSTSGPQLTGRTPTTSSNSNAAINLSGGEQVFITVRKEDTLMMSEMNAKYDHGVVTNVASGPTFNATRAVNDSQVLVGQAGSLFLHNTWGFNNSSGSSFGLFNIAPIGCKMVFVIQLVNTNATVTSITDSNGNTISLAVRSTATVGVSGVEIWSGDVGVTPGNITINTSAGNYNFDMYSITNCSGAAVDTTQSIVQTGSTTSLSLSQSSLTQNVLAFVGVGTAITGASHPAGPPWVDPEQFAAWVDFGYVAKGDNVSFSISYGATSNTAGCMACFAVTVADPQPRSLTGDVRLLDTGVMSVIGCGNIVNGTLATSRLNSRASAQSSPSAPTAPNSTAVLKMQGLAGSITPTFSGNIFIVISANCIASATTAGNGIIGQISYGTGSAPTNNAAVTGTQVGAQNRFSIGTTLTAAGNLAAPISWNAVVTGLSTGTTYWLDLAAQSITTISIVGLTNVSISAYEF